MKNLFLLLVAFLFLSAPALSQGDRPIVEMVTEKAGPIEFHVIPEVGAGVLLRDDQVVSFDRSDAFVIVRIPGLRFPGWNETSTGLQLELSDTPGLDRGIRYDIISYTRTKIAGPAYTGANVRFARGTTDIGTELKARVMPVVGIRMFTIAEHVPCSLEIELFDDNRPFKAAMILTWE